MSFDFQKNKISTFLIDILNYSLNLDPGLNNLIINTEDLLLLKNDKGDSLNTLIDQIMINMDGLRSALIKEKIDRNDLIHFPNENKIISLEVNNQKNKENQIINENEFYLMQLDIEKLLIENDNLIKINNSLKTQHVETLNQIRKEKQEDEERIELLSNDLEQQIDECIDLNQKICDLSVSDSKSKQIIISLINKISPTTEINENDSVTNLLIFFERLSISKPDENSIHNTSIIDLDNMQMESICWDGDHHNLEEVKQSNKVINICDQSCYNLEHFDSEMLDLDFNVMLEEIEQLDFEDCGQMDLLIKQSISMFMKRILIKFDCKQESEICIEVKKMFTSYSEILSKKLKSLQGTFDLNNTRVFEKLEEELIEICDVKKQFEILTKEKNSFNDIVKVKDNNIGSLVTEISSLTKKLQNMKYRTEELDKINNSFELKCRLLEEEVKHKELVIEGMKDDNHSCERALVMANESLCIIKGDLLKSEDLVQSMKEELTILQTKKYEAQCALKDFEEIKKLEDEFEILKFNLDKALEERNNYEDELLLYKSLLDEYKETINTKESSLLEKETKVKLLEEEIKTVNSASDERIIDLEIAIEDCIKVNEELEQIKCANLENERKIELLQFDLRTSETEKELLIKNMEKNIENSLKEYQDNLAILESENMAFRDCADSFHVLENDRNQITDNLHKLKIKYNNILTQFNNVEDEKLELKNSNDELEITCSNLEETIILIKNELEEIREDNKCMGDRVNELTEEIDIIRDKALYDVNELEIKILQMSNDLIANQTHIKDMLIEKEEMKITFKSFEESANAEILKLTETIDIKDSIILEITNNLKSKEDELFNNAAELNTLRETLDKVHKLEIILRAKEENLNELNNVVEDKNIELRSYSNELKLLRKSIIDKQCVAKLYEDKLYVIDSELKSLKNKFILKENENEELRKKIKESLQIQDNVVDKLQEEIKLLKTEINNESRKEHSEYDTLVNAYNELKDRYREKRRRTDELNVKYEKLMKFCKDRGLVAPSNN